ncbi:hypothetical protein Salat_1152100 [Sesamum alatum]|uniref:Mitochondrial transcription termination factor family protein n=1 Tax=Sesamum alatum TaxID=300844 RepID=A0AAE2CNM8_9LAMI|nr:hypothetical protein Salat_1152100 [Sesamum alatum]
MKALLRRNITCFFADNSSSIGKSSACFSLYALYFSTAGESKPLNSPTVFELLRHRHQLSPEVALHVSSVVTHLKTPENVDSMLSFLKEFGFTKTQLEKTLKVRPSLLRASLEKIIKPKIQIFQDLGFSAEDIAHIISKEPGVLHTSTNKRLIPALSLLKGILGSNEDTAKALRKSGWFLLTDLEKNLVPNVKFLENCGITREQISMLFNYLPRFLLYKPEIMRKCVDKVEEMGVSKRSKMFIYAVAVVGSMIKGRWELKLQSFRNILEFSEDDILRMLRQNPQVFSVSEDKMKKVKEVLLATGKYKTSCIVKYPKSLLYSIEKRYKPRFEVLGILESWHLIEKWPVLGTIYGMSDDKFFKVFVGPYLNEVGDAYLAQKAFKDRKEARHV